VLVDHGEARAAIAFSTDLTGDDKAVIVGRFAPESHAPIVYPAALTRGARNPQAAQALAFLRGPAARRIFAGFGYQVPARGNRQHHSWIVVFRTSRLDMSPLHPVGQADREDRGRCFPVCNMA
jgi:ABC-type Fe3+ transport system substrate-binding protein